MTGEHTSVIYGTHYPYRLFVGCLPPEAGAEDLGKFFSKYGNVVEAKVVLDDQGRSKRFGFVTFSNKDDVADLIKKRAIRFKEKMINVGPAVKKNLENENHSCRPTTAAPTPTVTTPPQQTPQPTPQPTQQTKQSIYRGPQHVPKTIIRKSPTEKTPLLTGKAPILTEMAPILTGMAPMLNGSCYDIENNFSNKWGISSRKDSVWSTSQSQMQSSSPALTAEHDVSYSCFSLDTSLNSLSMSSSSEPWWSNFSLHWDNSPWNRFGLGTITPPPGFYQADWK